MNMRKEEDDSIQTKVKRIRRTSMKSSMSLEEEDGTEIREEILEIREYQKEIFENCKEKNSIIFLETGTGKTLISILLINHYLLKYKDTKKVAFLANEVNLVEQQTNKIVTLLPMVQKLLANEQNTNYKEAMPEVNIQSLHGDMGIDYWNTSKWKKVMKEVDVFACTTQVFLNCLRRGYFKLNEFSLLIFDECHHADKNHAFNNIMKEFYYHYYYEAHKDLFIKKYGELEEGETIPTKSSDGMQMLPESITATATNAELNLPYIIGMTASPTSFSKGNISYDTVKTKLISLNLNSNFVFSEPQKIDNYINKANVCVKGFEEPLVNQLNYPGDAGEFIEKIAMLDNLDDIILPNSEISYLKDLLQQFDKIFYQSHKYDKSSLYICSLIEQLKKLFTNRALLIIHDLGHYIFFQYLVDIRDKVFKESRKILIDNEPKKVVYHDLEYMLGEFMQKYAYLNDPKKVSPKFLKLFQILQENSREHAKYEESGANPDSEFVTLIFVSRRLIAKYLKNLVMTYSDLNGGQFTANFIIGHRNTNLQVRSSQGDDIIKQIEDVNELDEQVETQLYSEVLNKRLFYVDAYKKETKNLNLLDMNYKLADQMKTINEFKQRKINLLISTSVTEEGFDIPNCNTVISYSVPKTVKSFIQLKGRARKDNSYFIIMSPESKQQLIQEKVDKYQKTFEMMKAISKELSSQKYDFEKQIQKEHENYRSFFLEETGACINTNWSIELLTYYCNFLKADQFIRSRPIYYCLQVGNDGYIYCIYLPPTAKLQIVKGELCKRKVDAKRLAAFICCKKLYEQGCFNHDLKPNNLDICGLDPKYDEEEIMQEDLDYKLLLEKEVIAIPCGKKRSDITYQNFYRTTNFNYFEGKYEVKSVQSIFGEQEKYIAYLYEVEYPDDIESKFKLPRENKVGFLFFNDLIQSLKVNLGIEFAKFTKKPCRLNFLQKILVSPADYANLLIVHFFLFLGSNSYDAKFFSILTSKELKNPAYFSYVGKNSLFSVSLGRSELKYALVTPLTKSNKIDFVLVENIKNFCVKISKDYVSINNGELFKTGLPQELIQQTKDFLSTNPTNYSNLIFFSVMNFRKFVISSYKEVNNSELRKLKVGKHNMQERKSFLEKNFKVKIEKTDQLLYLTNFYRDNLKNLKSFLMNDRERTIVYSFPQELTIYPVKLSFLLQMQLIPAALRELQSLLQTKCFRDDVLAKLEREAKDRSAEFGPVVFLIPACITACLWTYLVKLYDVKDPEFFNEATYARLSADGIAKVHCEGFYPAKNEEAKSSGDVQIKPEEEKKYEKSLHETRAVRSQNLVKRKRQQVIDENPAEETAKDNVDEENGEIDEKEDADENNHLPGDAYEPAVGKKVKMYQDTNPIIDKGLEEELFTSHVKIESLQTAVTFRGYDKENSYERLEFLGDSILKFLATVQVFHSFPKDSEGVLSKQRSRIVSNTFLKRACIKKEFYLYMQVAKLGFSPCGLKFNEQLNPPWASQNNSNKQADNEETKMQVESQGDNQGLADSKGQATLSQLPEGKTSLESKAPGSAAKESVYQDFLEEDDDLNTETIIKKIQQKEYRIPKNYVNISNKTLADVVESLTAVYYLSNQDLRASQMFLYSINVLAYPHRPFKEETKIYKDSVLSKIFESKDQDTVFTRKFHAVEAIIGYKFRNISLLIQAFTHISFRQVVNKFLFSLFKEQDFLNLNEIPESTTTARNQDIEQDVDSTKTKNVPNIMLSIENQTTILNKVNPDEFSYDRLEFLGDAVFDLIAVLYIWENFPEEDPNGFSILKAATVNNYILSLISLYYNFGAFLLIENTELEERLKQLREKVDFYLENPTEYFCVNESTAKVLGDVFEALVGAIFLDTEQDFNKTKAIVMRFAGKFLKKYAKKEYWTTSPYNRIKKLCEDHDLSHPRIRQQPVSHLRENERFMYCLFVKEQKVGEVFAESKREGELKLLHIAEKRLPHMFPENFKKKKKGEDSDEDADDIN